MGTQLSNRCKTALYRVTYGAPEQSVVYLMDGSRDAGFTRATIVLSALDGIATEDVCLYNLASFRELVDIGVSDDEDLRVFETGWQGPNVIAWAEHPLFLTDDPSLLGKWAELYADLAQEKANQPISRARS
jgi:hypothetical protein